jgi:alcohol dehydrogenase
MVLFVGTPLTKQARVAALELTILGSHGARADSFPELLRQVSSGKLRPQDLVERRVGLEEGGKEVEAMDVGSKLGMTMIVL